MMNGQLVFNIISMHDHEEQYKVFRSQLDFDTDAG